MSFTHHLHPLQCLSFPIFFFLASYFSACSPLIKCLPPCAATIRTILVRVILLKKMGRWTFHTYSFNYIYIDCNGKNIRGPLLRGLWSIICYNHSTVNAYLHSYYQDYKKKIRLKKLYISVKDPLDQSMKMASLFEVP